MSEQRSSSISRRSFLKATGAGAVATGLATIAPFRVWGQDQLSLLMWSHFVPRHDEWFDNEYVPAWGEENGVDVTVDHINVGDVPATIASEISAGSGHDIQEYIAPMPQHEPSVHDLSDVIDELESRYGPMLDLTRRGSVNPHTGKAFAFSHGFVIDPIMYRRSLWEAVDKPEGPNTWQDVLEFGARIFEQEGVPVGIGLSQEIDTNMATRAALWSFDASVQDEETNVVIDSDRTREAVNHYAEIFSQAMTPQVFTWGAASNNEAMISGRASMILNSISAYRSAQSDVPDVARDIFFQDALEGPRGSQFASEHVLYNAIVPSYVPSDRLELAKQFLIDLEANYDQRMWNSELYDVFAFNEVPVPEGDRGYPRPEGAETVQDLFDTWYTEDPFALEGEPTDKLQPLRNALDWSVWQGFPGPANPAAGEVFGTFVIPNMFAKVAQGIASVDQAVQEAQAEAEEIYQRWADQGLIPPRS